MAKQVILGSDLGRDALKVKCNVNFTELYDKDVALEEQINSLKIQTDRSLQKLGYVQNFITQSGSFNNLPLGVYDVGGWFSMTNYPTDTIAYGILMVLTSSTSVTTAGKVQMYFPNNVDYFYYRSGYDASYREWVKVLTNKQPDWISATLMNGWTGSLKYRKNNLGVVSIYGNVTAGTVTSNTVIATLPELYRPFVTFCVDAHNATTQKTVDGFIIGNSGNLIIRGPASDEIKSGDSLTVNNMFGA